MDEKVVLREVILWSVLGALFFGGLLLLGYGVYKEQPVAYISAVGVNGLLVWPVQMMVRLINRKRDLGASLAMIPLLDDITAQQKLVELIDILRKRV
jgi:hypothetical protein